MYVATYMHINVTHYHMNDLFKCVDIYKYSECSQRSVRKVQ